MIHQYKLNGYNIVLDVYSGSVHLVDEVAYDIIALYETTPRAAIVAQILAKYGHRADVDQGEILACLEDIDALKAAGKLFSQDLWKDVEQEAFQHTKPVLKALCLHVAHTCNLNCQYCFAAQGRYHGDRALMPFEVGKQALDFLIQNSGSRVNLEVDFFGGEPLMNWQVVKDLVAYARSQEEAHHKHFRFTLTTNGVLLDDEVTEFCNREMHNVVLSLDGRKEVHDRLRKNYAGQGSYDLIVPKFQRFVQQRGDRDYYIRGTFTHENTDFTNDIFHMADLGFTELSMEPVVSPPGEPWALTEEDLPVLFDQYEILAKEMLQREEEGRPFTFYHYMLDLEGGALPPQADVRLRLRHGVPGGDPLGGALPLPPVCQRPRLLHGGRVEGGHQHHHGGEVPPVQRGGQPRLPGLLGPALLRRRVRRQRLPRQRRHQRHL